jgi:hypothetical protein
MRRSNFALRVPPTLLAEARKAAESEGVALNQLITLALAEKVSAMRTEEYFEERARRADPARVSRILARVGKGNPPVEGDELPLEFPARKVRKKKGSETSHMPYRISVHISRILGATLGAAREGKIAPDFL